MFKPYKIDRREVLPMSSVMKLLIRRRGLSPGMNCQFIFQAWDKVSGAACYTLRKYFKDGVLYVGISSSVVRNQLYFRKNAIVRQINDELAAEPLYDSGKGFVKNIILR